MAIQFGLRSYSTKVHLIVISPNQNNMQESSSSARRSHLATNERRAVTQRQMRQLIATQASRRKPPKHRNSHQPAFPNPPVPLAHRGSSLLFAGAILVSGFTAAMSRDHGPKLEPEPRWLYSHRTARNQDSASFHRPLLGWPHALRHGFTARARCPRCWGVHTDTPRYTSLTPDHHHHVAPF